MTVKDIFNAIKDYKDLDIWIDDGEQMWSADGTRETAREMLDAINDGARVEARIYYDENGNRVSSSEYSSDVDVETIFDSDNFDEDEGSKRFVKVGNDQYRLNRFKQLGVFGVYNAIMNDYGEEHCYFDTRSDGFAYGDATRIISLTVYKDANGQPAQCNFAFFDKDENYKDNIEYDVTSWDDVIDHFVDEIE